MSQDQSIKVLEIWFIAHADFAIIPRCIVRCMQMSVRQMWVGCGGVCASCPGTLTQGQGGFFGAGQRDRGDGGCSLRHTAAGVWDSANDWTSHLRRRSSLGW